MPIEVRSKPIEVTHKQPIPVKRSLTKEVTAAHGQNRDATCKLPLRDNEKFFEVCHAVAMAQLERTLKGLTSVLHWEQRYPLHGRETSEDVPNFDGRDRPFDG